MLTRTFIFTLLFSPPNLNANPLGYEAYLDQVRLANGIYLGAKQSRAGSAGRESEAELVTAITLSGQVEYKIDEKIPQTPIVTYDSMDTGTYSIGFSKTTTFGLNAKVSFEASELKYSNSNIAEFGGQAITIDSGPSLQLTQSLWQNGFGASTRASIAAKRAQAKADYWQNQSTLDSTVQSALSAYWLLALQREVVAARSVAVELAQSVYDYNAKRARMNLGEDGDVLTAKALLESRKLDGQAARDQEAVCLRAFNQYRDRPFTEDPGPLASIDWEFLLSYRIPQKKFDRSDVKSAEYAAEATKAQARLSAENDRPVFDVYANYARDGRSYDSWGESASNAARKGRPTVALGLKLSMPLDFVSLHHAREGALALAEGADQNYRQKSRDQEADWIDLTAKVADMQKRIGLASVIEDSQRAKLKLERKRLGQGRSSTYQVLLFEQDYTSARLSRLQMANELISMMSRVRLYLASEG